MKANVQFTEPVMGTVFPQKVTGEYLVAFFGKEDGHQDQGPSAPY
jgi:hypothetical protein